MNMTKEEFFKFKRKERLTSHFTIDGIIEVTDGDYKGRIFHITEIYSVTETLTHIKCKRADGCNPFAIYKFDNACAKQIGRQDQKSKQKWNSSGYD